MFGHKNEYSGKQYWLVNKPPRTVKNHLLRELQVNGLYYSIWKKQVGDELITVNSTNKTLTNTLIKFFIKY